MTDNVTYGSIKLGDKYLTRSALTQRTRQAANGFSAQGFGQDDCFAICLRNDFVFFEASFAAAMIGALPVAVNWHFTVDEARYVFEDCAAKVIIIHADLAYRLRDAFPPTSTLFVVETPLEIAQDYGLTPEECAVPDGMIAWSEWRDTHAPARKMDLQLPRTIVYTSGTTGRPKGVKFAQATTDELEQRLNIVRRGFGFLDYIDTPEKITAVLTGPVYHSATCGYAMQAVLLGATLILQPRFDAAGLLGLIETERVTHLHMVPVMFHRLLALSKEVRHSADISSLRYVAHAAAPCSVQVKEAMINWWGPIIHEYYGGTETSIVTQCNTEEWLAHPGTVGRAIPEAKVRVVDTDGRDMPTGKPGEIISRAFGTADFTYHGDPEKRQEVECFGLIGLGDIGYFDEEGYLYLCDRNRDMIISGGVNIYPAEIEAELGQMPGVNDCAVFGIPDAEFGEAICAVIQPDKSSELDNRKVIDFLTERLARYKLPKTIEFRSELPREDTGKIYKRKLRDPFWERSGRNI